MSVADTPYYHVTSRCVRRAFLCGNDHVSGKSYEHRRGWIEDRVRVLASLFSIDIAAYAVMSNHYHLVVKLKPDAVNEWTDDEVLDRWTALFRGPLLVQRYQSGEPLNAVEVDTLASVTSVYRARLGCLSWFMKCLNEPIARKANAEDGCTGHFWEARFHSQALCSDKALITAMAYVDLNPIRAKMAKTAETSAYTSIQARITSRTQNQPLADAISRLIESGELRHFQQTFKPLLPFADSSAIKRENAAPIYEREYLLLIDNTARIVLHGKRATMNIQTAPILERLGLNNEQWVNASTRFKQHYRNGDLRLKQTA